MVDVRQAFDELQAYVTDCDPISLLSQLTLTFLFVPEEEFHGEASDVVTWQRWIEFLAALILVRPYPLEPIKTVDGPVLERLQKLLGQYFAAVERQLLFETTQTGENTERDMILAHAKIESLYVRGDAYPHQYYAFAQGLYGPHDEWFRKHYGFTIVDAVKLSQAIGQEYEGRCNSSHERAQTEAHRKADELVASHKVAESEWANVVASIGCALHFGNSEGLLGFTAEELSAVSGVSLQTCASFLKRMSQEFGYRNPAFPVPFTDPATAPWDYNTLSERPIVTRGGKYWLFVPPLLRSSLFNTFYYDLLNDAAYRPTFEKARGNYLESKTAECLRRVFPENMTLLNPLYPNGEEMCDVLVLHDHKLLLFQCKSKMLTRSARIGADFDVLRDDIRKAIADAFKQGIRARNYLQEKQTAEFTAGNRAFTLDMAQVNGLYLVGITSMPFQTLASRFANTNSALGLFSANEYPWSLSLGDLDIVTQVLSSPAQFLHYVLRRRQVEGTAFEIHADEMDFLGFYLSQGMVFSAKDFEGMNDVGLSGFSYDVDRWVHEKFELGHVLDPPRAPMPDGFSDFLKDVEQTGYHYRTDCAITLLEGSGRSRKRFMEMVAHTKERSLQDKGLHSFSVLLKDCKRGISFLSFDANADRIGLFKQAAAFAMMKKYDSKCDEWTGFGWDIASARAVDVAFFVAQPWTYDAKMALMAKDKLRPGQQIEF
ncbi:MAG: hypothetical protein WCA19_16050 [Candidatus Acidiferrales bacterium]